MQLFCPTVHPSNLGFATLLLKKKSNLENLPISFHGKLGVSKLSPPAVARRRMIGSRKRRQEISRKKDALPTPASAADGHFPDIMPFTRKKKKKHIFFGKAFSLNAGSFARFFSARGGGGAGGGGSYRNSFTGGRGNGKALHRRRGGGGLFFICLQQISQKRRKYRKLSLFFAQGSSINN